MGVRWAEDPALSTWAQKAENFLWLVREEGLRSGVRGSVCQGLQALGPQWTRALLSGLIHVHANLALQLSVTRGCCREHRGCPTPALAEHGPRPWGKSPALPGVVLYRPFI